MSTLSVLEYTAKAMECRQKASTTAMAGIEVIWRQIADHWDEMAEGRGNSMPTSLPVLGKSKHSKRNHKAPVSPRMA